VDIVSAAIRFSSASESNVQIRVLYHHWCNIFIFQK
jgi:hypothetical protein